MIRNTKRLKHAGNVLSFRRFNLSSKVGLGKQTKKTDVPDARLNLRLPVLVL